MDRLILYALERLGCASVTERQTNSLLKAIYEGKDVFPWLPTGFSKSNYVL